MKSLKRFCSNQPSAIDSTSLLAKSWADQILAVEQLSQSRDQVIQATARSIPLLEDASSVPFVCRYRSDIIAPLTTQQIHNLYSLLSKHQALESLRKKLFQVLPVESTDPTIVERIQTTTSKAELEDLYAPLKPPSKGSILHRIQSEYPQLVETLLERNRRRRKVV